VSRIFAAVVLFLSAVPGFADPPGFKNWDKSPEAYFLTREERKEWSRVRTDDAGREFIERYWQRRDPSPGTPLNEFRQEVLRRIGAADEQFTMRHQRGSASTRGRLLVVLGAPSYFSQQRPEQRPDPAANVRNANDLARLPGRERVMVQTWVYKQDKFGPGWELGHVEIKIQIDKDGGWDEPISSALVNDVLERAAERTLLSPDLFHAGAPMTAAMAGAPAGGIPAAPRALLESVTKENKPQPGSFWADGFRSATGERLLFLQFSIPAEGAPEVARFGGVIRTRQGEEILSLWEDARLAESASARRSRRVYQRAVALPPGEYEADFALFSPDGNQVLAAARQSVAVAPVGTEFDVSPLILTSEVARLAEAPAGPSAFLFGTDKPFRAEPKGDRLFSKEESLWYFLTIANPVPAPPGAAADPGAAAPKPRVQMRISVTRDGKPAFAPFASSAELERLGDALYASGSEIPLASFAPGYYTFSVTVRDLNAPRDSPAWKGAERKAEFIVLTPEGSLPPRETQASGVPRP
jgi:GWxTD domain-containing protein